MKLLMAEQLFFWRRKKGTTVRAKTLVAANRPTKFPIKQRERLKKLIKKYRLGEMNHKREKLEQLSNSDPMFRH